MNDDDLDVRLAALRERTEPIAASAALRARVLHAVGATRPSLLDGVGRVAWRGLTLSAVAAAAALVLAMGARGTLDHELTASTESAELDW
jgi:hypothetical protein